MRQPSSPISDAKTRQRMNPGDISMAQALREEGWSYAAIGREVGKDPTTVKRWLDPAARAARIERSRRYHRENSEQLRERRRQYYRKNKQARLAYLREYHKKRPEYNSWKGMMRRCYNPACPEYPNYGGRGISVYEKWRNSFDAFVADVPPRPSAKHSIERIRNHGNYEPGNVRWATAEEQSRNKRSNIIVTYKGVAMVLIDACKEAGVSYSMVLNRIRKGWIAEAALTTKPKRHFITPDLVAHIHALHREGHNKNAIAELTGCCTSTIRKILARPVT